MLIGQQLRQHAPRGSPHAPRDRETLGFRFGRQNLCYLAIHYLDSFRVHLGIVADGFFRN
jgi:hypothetical protein